MYAPSTQMKVNIFKEGEKTHRGRWVGDALTCACYLGCFCQSMYKKKSHIENREEKSRLGVAERRACCCGHMDSTAISGAADFLTMSWTERLERPSCWTLELASFTLLPLPEAWK